MTLVVDSSALITLARIGRLDLLRRVAGVVHVPHAVFEEVVQQGIGRPGSAEVAQAAWIHRHDILDVASASRLHARIGRGEAEAIVLAKQLGADTLVIDDWVARRVAESEGRQVVGLLGLLVHAKRNGLLSELKPTLDELRGAGFYLDETRYRALLRQAGE